MTMPTAQATMAMTLLQDKGLSCEMIRNGKAPAICYEFEGDNSKDICVQNWYENVDGAGVSSCAPALMTLDLARENVLILGQPYVEYSMLKYQRASLHAVTATCSDILLLKPHKSLLPRYGISAINVLNRYFSEYVTTFDVEHDRIGVYRLQ